MSYEFYKKIKDDFYCKETDWLKLKGKEEWLTFCELIRWKTQKNIHYQQEIDAYEEYLHLYYTQEFHQSLEKIKEFLITYPENTPGLVLQKYCLNYISYPPSKDWNGVYVAKTK